MTDTEVTYKFDELSDRAKDKAREAYTGDGYLDYDWWDSVYEDAVRVAEILGISIDNRSFKTMGGKTCSEPDIGFSGFSSQGDGASFSGHYRYNSEAVAGIRGYCPDEELHRIADELGLIHIIRRLMGLHSFKANVRSADRGFTLSVEVIYDEDSDEDQADDTEDKVTQLMRDFADWIYGQLESQYDWLMSDECVDEYLRDDMTFDETGVEV